MICANCVRNVENLFNSGNGILAKVDLANKTASIHTKQKFTNEDAVKILYGTSYTLIHYEEEIQ